MEIKRVKNTQSNPEENEAEGLYIKHMIPRLKDKK